MTDDPYAHLDGAYVLGALDADEHVAFEQHLLTCAACRARVHEIAGVPAALSGVTLDDMLSDLAADTDAGPVPDTLLPRLVREARTTNRRRRTLVSAAGLVAAACVAALVAVLVTSRQPAARPAPDLVAMQQVIPTPVHAQVGFVAEHPGTRIVLKCHYQAGPGGKIEYEMTVTAADGRSTDLTSWYIKPGQDLTFRAHSDLDPDQIRQVDVTLADGRSILRWHG